jgi:hypothetical protein
VYEKVLPDTKNFTRPRSGHRAPRHPAARRKKIVEAARGGNLETAADCLIAFRDGDGTDHDYAGALLLADGLHDLRLIRSAFQKK